MLSGGAPDLCCVFCVSGYTFCLKDTEGMGHKRCLFFLAGPATHNVVILPCKAVSANIHLGLDWEAGRDGSGVLVASHPMICQESYWWVLRNVVWWIPLSKSQLATSVGLWYRTLCPRVSGQLGSGSFHYLHVQAISCKLPGNGS